MANTTMRDMFFGHRRDPHRRVAVQVAHRARVARREAPVDSLTRLAHQVGLLVGPRARVIERAAHRVARGRRHRRGPRGGRLRVRARDLDARGHRDEHRGRGHRRVAVPRRVLSGGARRSKAGWCGSACPGRTARSSRCASTTTVRLVDDRRCGAAGHLWVRVRRPAGRAATDGPDESDGPIHRGPRRVPGRDRAGASASPAPTRRTWPRPRRPTTAGNGSCSGRWA